MHVAGVPECIVVIQVMCNGANSKFRVNGSYSDEFAVKVGVHEGSILSPLLFIIVLEKFHTSCPWKIIYADDLHQ